MSDEKIHIMLTVHTDDDPILFDFLSGLTTNKHRRRARLIRLLQLGMQTEQGGFIAAPAAARSAPANQPQGGLAATAPRGEPPRPPEHQPPAAPIIEIEADDLASVFRT